VLPEKFTHIQNPQHEKKKKLCCGWTPKNALFVWRRASQKKLLLYRIGLCTGLKLNYVKKLSAHALCVCGYNSRACDFVTVLISVHLGRG